MRKFFITLFIRQNKHHKHCVFVHTIKVFKYALLASKNNFLVAALLHDIGKPFTAVLDEDGYDFSFTNHEEKSYQIIKKWPFISQYTKNLVRYHYLRRRIEKDSLKLKEGKNSSNGDIITQEKVDKMKKLYDSFDFEFKKDLRLFQILDDKAKGK
jgi:putative nucleotidyltransferase with HDIG domain